MPGFPVRLTHTRPSGEAIRVFAPLSRRRTPSLGKRSGGGKPVTLHLGHRTAKQAGHLAGMGR